MDEINSHILSYNSCLLTLGELNPPNLAVKKTRFKNTSDESKVKFITNVEIQNNLGGVQH